MKRFYLATLAVGLCLGVTTFGFGQTAHNHQDADAHIATALAFTSGSHLNFGTIINSADGGTVTVDFDGSAIAKTGTLLLTTQGDAAARSTYVVTGDGTYTFSITLPSDIEITNGTEHMHVTDWTTEDATVVSLSGGEATFHVGATLTVGTPTDNPSGAYVGDFEVGIAYD
jgi:hypothetical protein